MRFARIAIAGGKGMLGSDLVRAAEDRQMMVRVYDLPEFDITNEQHVREMAADADAIVNCAAYTNVEKAESQPELADAVNGYAVGQLGRIAHSRHIPVLHISTDFVFDGTQSDAYTETDLPHPVSAYGRSKLLGETLLAQSGCDYCIIRVQWTYGKNGVNFITKILDAAKTRDSLQVVDDQIGSPTHTLHAAGAICDCLALEAFPKGLFHYAAGGSVSRYAMTTFMFDLLGIKTPVKPCKTADFPMAAQRPLNSRFSCQKIQQLLNRPIPTWQAMLTSYLETL